MACFSAISFFSSCPLTIAAIDAPNPAIIPRGPRKLKAPPIAPNPAVTVPTASPTPDSASVEAKLVPTSLADKSPKSTPTLSLNVSIVFCVNPSALLAKFWVVLSTTDVVDVPPADVGVPPVNTVDPEEPRAGCARVCVVSSAVEVSAPKSSSLNLVLGLVEAF